MAHRSGFEYCESIHFIVESPYQFWILVVISFVCQNIGQSSRLRQDGFESRPHRKKVASKEVTFFAF